MDQLLEELILDGCVEIAGIDPDTSDFLYTFTPKMLERLPEMYNRAMAFFDKEIQSLWELGFINMDVTEVNPLVTITDKAFDEKELSKLSPELRRSLDIIMFYMKK